TFFFQAEDRIRDPLVTGVQTCALPISANIFGFTAYGHWVWAPRVLFTILAMVPPSKSSMGYENPSAGAVRIAAGHLATTIRASEIGRATCRETSELREAQRRPRTDGGK